MNFPASKCRNVAGGAPGGMFPPELKRIKKLDHQFSLVIKLSLTSWIVHFFSLILLTFHPGKINISKSKNNWQNKKEISIKIFFTISLRELLLWFKHWPISLYFVFPAVSICTLYKADLIKIILSRSLDLPVCWILVFLTAKNC